MDRKQVAHILEEIGVLLELKGENPFKARAYYNGARVVETLTEDLSRLVSAGKLGNIKGIGQALEEKISELVRTGRLAYYEELRNSFPPGLLDLLRLPGLGPKKVSLLYRELGITNLGELEYACRENRLLSLPGFGAKTQANVLAALERQREYRRQFRWGEVAPLAHELVAALREIPGVRRAEVAGSLRRLKEVVKDVDVVAELEVGTDREQIAQGVARLTEVERLVAAGETKLALELKGGPNCDVRLVSSGQYPWALVHFTGSKEHNTVLRHLAKEQGLKLNEYGLFRDEERAAQAVEEAEVYRALGLAYIPPELRENLGEIEQAQAGELPELVKPADLKGAWHVHTQYSDGVNTLEEMARQALGYGWSFLGIADHSQSAFYAHGLKEEDIRRQWAEIDALNGKLEQEGKEFRLLKGIEADILPDGQLDYPEEILAGFDFVIASVHSRFKMDEESMTKRLIRALEHPQVTMLGHPTGRLLLAREGYSVNLRKVLEAAAANGKAVELNASPYRLDLDWRWCRVAKELGVKIAINPDAHRLEELAYVSFGVNIARKGWLQAEDVLNTHFRGMADFMIKGK